MWSEGEIILVTYHSTGLWKWNCHEVRHKDCLVNSYTITSLTSRSHMWKELLNALFKVDWLSALNISHAVFYIMDLKSTSKLKSLTRFNCSRLTSLISSPVNIKAPTTKLPNLWNWPSVVQLIKGSHGPCDDSFHHGLSAGEMPALAESRDSVSRKG